MKPIVLAAPSANTGKTELACALIRALPGAQALKITRFHRESHCPVHGVDEHGDDNCDGCDPAPAGFELVSDEARLHATGKDTDRMWLAGARPVRWLRAAPHVFEYALGRAMAEFTPEKPLIVEGNSAACVPAYDATVVLIWPQSTRGVKASVVPALKQCEVLVLVETEDGRKCLPPTLRQTCARNGVSLETLPEPVWLPANWWQNGQISQTAALGMLSQITLLKQLTRIGRGT